VLQCQASQGIASTMMLAHVRLITYSWHRGTWQRKTQGRIPMTPSLWFGKANGPAKGHSTDGDISTTSFPHQLITSSAGPRACRNMGVNIFITLNIRTYERVDTFMIARGTSLKLREGRTVGGEHFAVQQLPKPSETLHPLQRVCAAVRVGKCGLSHFEVQ